MNLERGRFGLCLRLNDNGFRLYISMWVLNLWARVLLLWRVYAKSCIHGKVLERWVFGVIAVETIWNIGFGEIIGGAFSRMRGGWTVWWTAIWYLVVVAHAGMGWKLSPLDHGSAKAQTWATWTDWCDRHEIFNAMEKIIETRKCLFNYDNSGSLLQESKLISTSLFSVLLIDKIPRASKAQWSQVSKFQKLAEPTSFLHYLYFRSPCASNSPSIGFHTEHTYKTLSSVRQHS